MAKKSTKQTKTSQVPEQTHPQAHPEVRKPSQLRAFWAITKYATLAAARNKATLAFGFIFPVAFVSVFGLLGNSSTSVKLGLDDATYRDNPVVQALSAIDVVELRYGNTIELRDEVEDGTLNGLVSIEDTSQPQQAPSYQVTIVTANNPTTSGPTLSLLQGVIDKINLQLAGVNDPAIELTQQSIDSRSSRYIDFALPGQIGFALLSTAIFGTVFGFISLKRTLVLKRLFATPTQPLTFLAAQGASRLFWALLQTIVIVAFGVVAFQFYLPHGWVTFIELLVMSVIGLIAFLGFGYFMAGLANDENSAGPLVNLVTLPQFLLSGVFFPTDNFPSWVQPIANNLPLSYFNQAMRDIATEGAHLTAEWPYVLGLLVWGGAMYLLAARTFKWE